jgi:hypothetical protein
METEGRLDLNEPQIYDAEDKAEAMWKYHAFLFSRNKGNDMREYHKNLEEYRKSEYATGGWGYHCRELKV